MTGAAAAPWAGRLSRTCLVATALLLLATALAVVAGWPAQFGGPGDRDAVAAESLTRGTALSPPAVPLLVFALAGWAAARPGRAGTAARVLLVPVALAFVVGGLGEARAAQTPDVPQAALLVSGASAVVLGVLVLVLAWAALLADRRTRGRGDRA
jgi:hypothetical protein